MSNKAAFTIGGVLALLAMFSWFSVETPFAEKYNLSNGLLYSCCVTFGLTGIVIIVRRILNNR